MKRNSISPRCIVAAIAVPLMLLLAAAQAQQGNLAPDSPTATADALMKDRVNSVADQLSSSIDLLSKLRAKTAALAKDGDDTKAPGIAGGTFTQTVAKPQPAAEASRTLDNSSFQLQ